MQLHGLFLVSVLVEPKKGIIKGWYNQRGLDLTVISIMNISDDQIDRWAAAPSETEEEKCQRTVNNIKEIITAKFGSDVEIFLQGSYKNRTNIRQDSDVDIVVLHNGYYFPDTFFLTPADKKAYDDAFIPSDYNFSTFKDEIQNILLREFGGQNVLRKNKCIRVEKNDYRVNADVVPCFVHRRMKSPTIVGEEGIQLRTDIGEKIYSFPKQHFDNGATKNADTYGFYKSLVRILKNVRNDLVDTRDITDKDMPSFFLECLVWNVPDVSFSEVEYVDATKNVIRKIWNDMRDAEKANSYAEVSDLRWLFKGSNREPKKAEDFMLKAWEYIGY